MRSISVLSTTCRATRSCARVSCTVKPPSCNHKMTMVCVLLCAPSASLMCHLVVLGLKATMESIDNRSDFKVWMQSYIYAHGGQNARGPRRNGPQDEGFVRLHAFASQRILLTNADVLACSSRPFQPFITLGARRALRMHTLTRADRRLASASQTKWRATTSTCHLSSSSVVRRSRSMAWTSRASTGLAGRTARL